MIFFDHIIGFIVRLFCGRSLREALTETKKIKVLGVIFKIRKIDAMEFATGAQVIHAVYKTYEQARELDKKADQLITKNDMKKIRDYYREILMAGVVKPVLSRDGDGESISVEDVLQNIGMAETVVTKIHEYTYGKKKVALSAKSLSAK